MADYDISTYEYELIKRRDLDYEYMLACKKCLQLEETFCDFQELQTAIANKVHAKEAYELQEKVVQFALYGYKTFIEVRNAFKHNLLEKCNLLEKGWTKTHFLEKSVAKNLQ